MATLLKALRLKSSEKHELRQPGKQSSNVFNKIFLSIMSLLSNEATKNKNTHRTVFNIMSLLSNQKLFILHFHDCVIANL